MTPKQKSDVKSLVSELVKVRLRCQPVLAIVGSGISVPAIPLMDEIIQHALRTFNEARFADDPVLRANPKLRTDDGLRKLFQDDPDPILRRSRAWKEGVTPWLTRRDKQAHPRRQHRAVMGLLRANLFRAVVTTNWDCLLERAIPEEKVGGPSDGRISEYLVIREPAHLRSWAQQPRALPALVKIHGDVRERRCENDHVIVSESAGPQDRISCPQCGLGMDQRVLLPDSARRLSREMLELFQGRNGSRGALRGRSPRDEVVEARAVEQFEYLGAIVIIGFSGRFDRHLQDLITARAKGGCLIAQIDLKPLRVFGGGERQLQGDAGVLVPELAKQWREASDSAGLAWSAGQVPALRFSGSEERFDALFGRIPITDVEARILSHPEYARLRYIKQLGQKQRFYPSADHTRFEHSVASLSVVDVLYSGLSDAVARAADGDLGRRALAGYRPTAAERRLVRLATLFHDFGHVWFSHLGEDVLTDLMYSADGSPIGLRTALENVGKSHEGLARSFLQAGRAARKGPIGPSLGEIVEGEMRSIEAELGVGMEDFFSLLTGESRLGHLNALIASNIDADKLEYLSRDGDRTGKGGGSSIRADMIAQGIEITEFGRMTVQLDAVSVVERVAAERYLMFQSVYHDDRVRVLEASLVQVLIEFLREELNVADEARVFEVLLKREVDLMAEVRGRADRSLKASAGAEAQLRYKHWQTVLDLVAGEGAFPPLEVWLLHPSSHVKELPVEDARLAVEGAYGGMRSELGDLFWTRYRYRAVFALNRFKIHTGISEVAVSGERELFAPGEVSPLIAGLQDVRRVPLRLAVLYYDSGIRDGCREEIGMILERRKREFEVTVRRGLPGGSGGRG